VAPLVAAGTERGPAEPGNRPGGRAA